MYPVVVTVPLNKECIIWYFSGTKSVSSGTKSVSSGTSQEWRVYHLVLLKNKQRVYHLILLKNKGCIIWYFSRTKCIIRYFSRTKCVSSGTSQEVVVEVFLWVQWINLYMLQKILFPVVTHSFYTQGFHKRAPQFCFSSVDVMSCVSLSTVLMSQSWNKRKTFLENKYLRMCSIFWPLALQ